MKNPLSLCACIIIAIVLFSFRLANSDIATGKPLVVTKWDAFGYYQYLPAMAIYHDYKGMAWADAIDKRYGVSGGDGLPLTTLDNGNRVCKYLGGVAILQAPLFFIAHGVAGSMGYPADGFSPPYQYALVFGVILYCLLALFLMRHILLQYFRDGTVAVTLLLLCLATNFVQYAAVDGGLSHAYIFPLYVLIIYCTIQWHKAPSFLWAGAIGYIIGLAMISRPTEAIMLFIPLLWGTQNKESSKTKWALVKAHKSHLIAVLFMGLIGILPQLLYWKSVTGSFVYDVGSKWVFFNPYFRVLTGWEKGWFIYTPVTVFFIIGMFFMKKYPFKKAVLTFCLLNIWIIIAWDEWRYGASYSTRALVQSYPVFALPLAAFIDHLWNTKWRVAICALGAYLIGVNLFQTVQYNKTILHYDDMNRQYYGRIYLNPNPSPLDMSLLDTHEVLKDENGFHSTLIFSQQAMRKVRFSSGGNATLFEESMKGISKAEKWIKVEAQINAPNTLWGSKLGAELSVGDSVKRTEIRLFNPVGERTSGYAFYMRVPEYFSSSMLKLYITSPFNFDGEVMSATLTQLER
jgi:hypothetical protein